MANPDGIKTKRLVLETLSPDHAKQLYDKLNDEDLYTYQTGDAPNSLQQLRRRYEFLCKGSPRPEQEHWFNWVARWPAKDDYSCYFQATVQTDKTHLAYTTFKPYQRQGLAKEGIQGVIDWLHRAMAVRSFIVEMDCRNLASVHLAESLGFVWQRTTNNVGVIDGFQSHEFTFALNLN